MASLCVSAVLFHDPRRLTVDLLNGILAMSGANNERVKISRDAIVRGMGKITQTRR
jgi:hypothetical protein